MYFFVIITVLLVTILTFFSFENLFITFNSLEEAFYYYNGDRTTVRLVVNGKGSNLVIGDNKDSNVYLIVPKTADVWKTGIGINYEKNCVKDL